MNSLDSTLEYGLLMGENSNDIHDVRDELRMQLIVLNADLKKLKKDWDFSAILRPFLEDTMAPSFSQIDRMRKQKERMTTLKDDFLRQEQERKVQERKEQEQSRPAPPPAAAASTKPGGGPRKRRAGDSIHSIQNRTSETPCIPQNAEVPPISMPTPCIRRSPPIPENLGFPVTPAPIEPNWGPLKRYTEQCTEKTYHQAVAAAEWLYAYMRSVEGGPALLTSRALQHVPPALWPRPPLTLQRVKSYLGSQILAWENVRMAALEGDWTLIQVGYNRQTDMVAARMQQNPTRRKFSAWAVNYRPKH